MKTSKTISSVLLSLCIMLSGLSSKAQTTLWERTAGGDGIFNHGYGISTDAAGNCYVMGEVDRVVNFSTTITFTCAKTDIFIAKYDNLGNLQWAKKAGSTEDDYARAICTDALGNSYIAGACSTSAQFDAISVPQGNFIAKYDPNGNCVWANSISCAWGTPSSICLDANGNAYVLCPPSIAKIDRNGNCVYTYQGAITNFSAMCYSNGFLYTTGTFSGIVVIDTFGLTSNGSTDVFVAKFDTAANVIWAKSGGGPNSDYGGKGIAVDASNNCYVIGDFYNNATFGTVSLFHSGSAAPFLLKYDASGTPVQGWEGISGSTLLLNSSGAWYISPQIQCYDNADNLFTTGHVNACSWTSDPLTSCVYVSKEGSATGINSVTNKEVEVFPNPMQDILYVDGLSSGAKVQLFNMFGKLLKASIVTQNKLSLNVKELIPGFYFVKITDRNGGQVIRKVTKC